MRKVMFWFVLAIIQCFFASAQAYDLRYSGRTEIWDNPFIAFGYNPATKITTGYLAALRTAPGRTDECKLIFSGGKNGKDEFFAAFIGEHPSTDPSNKRDNRIFLISEKNSSYLKFSRKNLGGDCDWILPFVVETDLSENRDQVLVELNVANAGAWISVYVIGAQKARFYSRPDSSSARKAYLVKGDIIYVYDERPDWYYIKYDEGKTKTEGWIRKSDTLQP